MKIYATPEIEVVKLNLKDALLAVSQDENSASGGGMHDPGEDPLIDDGL